MGEDRVRDFARHYSVCFWARCVSHTIRVELRANKSRFPIPGGDLREMKPYLILNTNLRRLGCGGRAAMGMESPMSVSQPHFHISIYLTQWQLGSPTKVLRALPSPNSRQQRSSIAYKFPYDFPDQDHLQSI